MLKSTQIELEKKRPEREPGPKGEEGVAGSDSIAELKEVLEYKNPYSQENTNTEEPNALTVGTTFMIFGKEYVVTYVNEGKKRMTIEPYNRK